MANRDLYTAAQFIKAIPGTGGIISAIATSVGCTWHTAKKYIDTYPTIQRAYDDERERLLDHSESLVRNNILLLLERQRDEHVPVDATDAKWYLTMKGRDRGYAERKEMDADVILRVLYGDDGDGDENGG